MNSLQISHILLPETHIPRHQEIPNVGLYLKQVVIYINDIVEPLLHTKVTPTMLSNYVKLHLVSNPTKKMYHRDQIATLLFIVLMKNILSLDQIRELLELSSQKYELPVSYNYFCDKLEEMLQKVATHDDNILLFRKKDTVIEKHLLENIIVTFVQRLYLEECFLQLSKESDSL